MVFTNPMDYKNAQQKLSELRDSLDKVLGSKTEGPSREDAEEALKTAKDGARRAKKTLLARVKDFPVVDKIAQLGTAGTVAVGTAAVTQTNIAVDETEVFVASVANDVVEQRFYVPPILDRIVDFPSLDSWGQKVMQEKIAEVKAEAAKVQAKVVPVVEKEETKTKSQATEETKNQEPQAQKESAKNSEEDRGDTEGTKQDAKEVESAEIESEETQESKEEAIAEPVPDEESGESADEIDPIKPHSDIISDESEMIINPNDDLVVSPEGPKQV